MRLAILAFISACLVFGPAVPALAAESTGDLARPAKTEHDSFAELTKLAALRGIGELGGFELQAVPGSQVPNVRPFQSAHFDLSGTAKYDGITIDILGDGDLSPPDRQRSAFKFGPITVEIIMLGDQIYSRSRFDRTWSRELIAQPGTAIGPFSSAGLESAERNVRLIGSEVVDGVRTEHYTTTLEVREALEPLIGQVPNDEARSVLETLKGSIDVWVGTSDRMIRQERLLLSLTIPAFEPEGEVMDAIVDMTVAYSRLDEEVSIGEPRRNDPTPLRTPRPNVTPVSGPPGSPTGQRGPTRAPAQIPGR